MCEIGNVLMALFQFQNSFFSFINLFYMCKTDTFFILYILVIFTSDFLSILTGILENFSVNKKILFFDEKVLYFLHKLTVLCIIIVRIL